MKTLRTFVLLLLAALFLAPLQAEAQIFKKLKKRAEDRVKERLEQKAEEKVDEVVDRAVDSAWARAEDRVADAATSAVTGMGGLFAGQGLSEEELAPLGSNAAAPADAVYLRYMTTTRVEAGALAALSRLVGQDLFTNQETITLSRARQRTDGKDQSTLIDVEGRRIVTLDHQKRTYHEMTFEQLAAMMASLMAQSTETAAPQKGAGDEAPPEHAEFTFDVRTEQTGRREAIHGLDAAQSLLIVETQAEATQDGQTTRGTFFTVIDVWNAAAAAGTETMRAFQQALAETLGEQMQESASASFGRLGQDPRLGPAMEHAAREMQAVQGLPVRSTMHVVLVPEGAALDLDAVLGSPAPAAAEAGEAGSAPRQSTLMRVTTQISDLQPLAYPGGAFDIPEGYTPVSHTE